MTRQPKTVEIPKGDGAKLIEVFGKIADSKMPNADRERLSKLLGFDLDDDFYMMEENRCQNCGKEISFYDLVKSAMDDGTHSAKFFIDLLTSDTTIIRKEGSEKIIACSACGHKQIVLGGYACSIYAMW